MEASGSGEHVDKRLKINLLEEKENPLFEATGAFSNWELEVKKWSFLEEIYEALDDAMRDGILGGSIKLLRSKDGQAHGYECRNVLTIWTSIRKYPEIREDYPHVKVPKDIGEVIMKNLLKRSNDWIQKSSVIHDVGFVAFSLSRRWLAQRIHKMLKVGIDAWAPSLPVKKVMVDFPSLDEEINLGWFQQRAIASALERMLCYSNVDVVFCPSSRPELMTSVPPLQCQCLGKSISFKQIGEDVVIYVENKPPFILAMRDYNAIEKDLKTLWFGTHDKATDWIVYLTPVRQQEYIEMLFAVAKLEGWLWNIYKPHHWDPHRDPHREKKYPVLTYAGYRTYSIEELPNLLKQIKDRCDMVALGEDAQLLGYNAEAVSTCVLIYTCLKNYRLADCTFNYDEMVNEEGNTFVYLLRRRAEVHRITNYYRKDIDELKKASILNLKKYEGWEWEESEERRLEFQLLEFTEVLDESCIYVLPHAMCEYLYTLSEIFKSYNDFVLRTESFAETNRLLLCEATEVVMGKCFYLMGITPEVTITTTLPILKEAQRRGDRLRSFAPMTVGSFATLFGVEPQKMAEREQIDGTRLDPDFVDHFITPCFVSVARDQSRNSRFEMFAISPLITDPMFEKGYLCGLISIPDKYGLAVSVGYFLSEPDFPYVSLFQHDWCDPVKIDMRHAQPVYLDNPSSHHSVSFSSSMELRIVLHVSTETYDDFFKLCDSDTVIDLENFWGNKLVGKCGSCTVDGDGGRLAMYYVLLKDAVDAALEICFIMKTDREVHGEIFAYYGDEFCYDCDPTVKNYYKALLYSSDPPTPGLEKSGPVPLKRSVLAVPKNASLTIEAHFVEPETRDIILFDRCNLKTPTKEDSNEGFTTATVYGTDCKLDLKVIWK